MRRAEKKLAEWVASRPLIIQEAIRRWPIGTTLEVDGKMLYLLGWTGDEATDVQDVMLIFSPVNPFEDHAGAQKEKVYICGRHLVRKPRPL